jgi:hypothetical protein
VTGPEAENVALRISGAYGVSDTTDVPLNIRGPRVTVVAPNGSEHLIIDETIRLRWIAEGLDSPIAIGLWRGEPVNQFDTLYLSTENDSEEIWTITGPAASGCYLAVFYANNLALHDTSDGGFFIDLADPAQDPSSQLPKEFALSDVYPNPFNSILHIRYALPINSTVELVLYNLLGQQVAILRRQRELAGMHEIAWQADGIASGLYLLRMRTEQFTTAQKIHYLK